MDLGEDVEPNVQEKEEKMATLKEDEKNSMTKQRAFKSSKKERRKSLLIECPASLEEELEDRGESIMMITDVAKGVETGKETDAQPFVDDVLNATTSPEEVLSEENEQERKFIITYTYSMETEFMRRKELHKIEKKLKHHMFESLCVVCPAQRRLLENENDGVPDGIFNVCWLASLDTDLITRSCQPELDANNTCTVCTMVKS